MDNNSTIVQPSGEFPASIDGGFKITQRRVTILTEHRLRRMRRVADVKMSASLTRYPRRECLAAFPIEKPD